MVTFATTLSVSVMTTNLCTVYHKPLLRWSNWKKYILQTWFTWNNPSPYLKVCLFVLPAHGSFGWFLEQLLHVANQNCIWHNSSTCGAPCIVVIGAVLGEWAKKYQFSLASDLSAWGLPQNAPFMHVGSDGPCLHICMPRIVGAGVGRWSIGQYGRCMQAGGSGMRGITAWRTARARMIGMDEACGKDGPYEGHQREEMGVVAEDRWERDYKGEGENKKDSIGQKRNKERKKKWEDDIMDILLFYLVEEVI